MSTYMQFEILLFFRAAAMGVLLIVCYDFLKVFRIVLPHPSVVVICEDVIFWICAGVGSFFCIYHSNQGKLRVFWFLGNLFGVWCYTVTVQGWIQKILKWVLSVPVFFAKKTINGLLFLVKRGKIFVYNFEKAAVFGGKQQIFQSKRGKRVEKIKKKGKEKYNSE